MPVGSATVEEWASRAEGMSGKLVPVKNGRYEVHDDHVVLNGARRRAARA
jgi:hypothetical protein